MHYGVPLDTNTQVLVYNTDLIKTPPTTFDELKATAESLEGSDTYGLALGGSGPWNVFPWFWSAGGTVTNEDFTKATGFLDSAESVAALQWLVDFNSDGLLGPSSIGGDPDSVGALSPASMRRSVTVPGWSPRCRPTWATSLRPLRFRRAGGLNLSRRWRKPRHVSTSENQEAAWEFEKFMLSDEAQGSMAEVGQIPATKSGLESDAVTSVDYLAPYVEQLQTAQARTPVPTWTQIDPILTDAFNAALRGAKTPQEALSAAAAQIDPLLTN